MPIFLILMLAVMGFAHAQSPNSFNQAKKIAGVLFEPYRQTLYCRCPYNEAGHVDLARCGMRSASSIKRAQRMEWE